MHLEYIDSPRLIGKQYIPLGSWGTFHEDLGTRAGMNRELRTDMISRLRPGDGVRATSVRAFCDGPLDLKRLVHEIIVDHAASIEFVQEHVTIKASDLDHLDVILRRLTASDPWKPILGPMPTATVKFGPEFREAFDMAAEATRRLRERGYQNMLRASEKGKNK